MSTSPVLVKRLPGRDICVAVSASRINMPKTASTIKAALL